MVSNPFSAELLTSRRPDLHRINEAIRWHKSSVFRLLDPLHLGHAKSQCRRKHILNL